MPLPTAGAITYRYLTFSGAQLTSIQVLSLTAWYVRTFIAHIERHVIRQQTKGIVLCYYFPLSPSIATDRNPLATGSVMLIVIGLPSQPLQQPTQMLISHR
jgi:hypothetical protein